MSKSAKTDGQISTPSVKIDGMKSANTDGQISSVLVTIGGEPIGDKPNSKEAMDTVLRDLEKKERTPGVENTLELFRRVFKIPGVSVLYSTDSNGENTVGFTGNVGSNSVSLIIRNELKAQNIRFYANDNIHIFVANNRLPELEKELTKKFEQVLDTLIIDRENDPNSQDTANRLARMYLYEIMAGRYSPPPKMTTFPNEGEEKYDGLLVIRAEFKSLCSHHHQPITGVAYIGILPNGRMLGLSKYTRLVQWHAARGTLQEELCNRIVKSIVKITKTEDVACHIMARHGCCENRGVQAHSSLTQTTVLSGRFYEEQVKAGFFSQIKLSQQVQI